MERISLGGGVYYEMSGLGGIVILDVNTGDNITLLPSQLDRLLTDLE